jgi:hypothetical protein
MLGQYIYTAAMSISSDREALFNHVYETEHIPALKEVPGVVQVRRYRHCLPPDRIYLAVYELASPDLPTSAGWLRARDLGRWPTEVRPYTSGLQNGLWSLRRGFGSDLPHSSGYVLLLTRGDDSPGRAARLDRDLDAFAAHPTIAAGARYVDIRDHAQLLVVRIDGDAALQRAAELAGDLSLTIGRPQTFEPV